MINDEEVIIRAKSKSKPDESYWVTFTLEQGFLYVSCTCPAGENDKMCKHRVRLLSNDQSMLFDRKEKELLSKVLEWASLTDFPMLIETLSQLEKEVERANKIIKPLKEKIGRLLSGGLSIKGGESTQ